MPATDHDLLEIRALVAEHAPGLLPAMAGAIFAATQVSARDQLEARHQAAMAERNRLLRAAATMLPPPPGRERRQGLALLRCIRRYAATRWSRDSRHTSCPPDIIGSVEENIWRALKLGELPATARQMNNILCGEEEKTSMLRFP